MGTAKVGWSFSSSIATIRAQSSRKKLSFFNEGKKETSVTAQKFSPKKFLFRWLKSFCEKNLIRHLIVGGGDCVKLNLFVTPRNRDALNCDALCSKIQPIFNSELQKLDGSCVMPKAETYYVPCLKQLTNL